MTIKREAVLAFVLSAVLGAIIWALSMPLTGKSEPWDSEGPYYFVALALAGAVAGAIIPKHLPAHFAGAIVGQAAYELVFLGMGIVVVLGLAFLLGYTTLFLAGAAIAASLRNRHHKGDAA